MTLNNHLVIFAKEPRMGRVKTRLAADIGQLAALNFYRQTLFSVTNRLACDRRWHCGLAVTPDASVFDDGPWPKTDFRMSQGQGDLGQRMGRVMEILPPGPVVIIGGDVPDIQAHHIADAFAALGKRDAVFGPAKDGGYWLVGMKRRPVFLDIFQNVRWSTKHALADTVANLGSGQCHALLEMLTDIDDGKDYRGWGKS
ncbi:MAG: TIGR04282 family arsenosugar biosynthesis glycosyltransferase [Proteobacteria bacterium]|nr:TIGR04282 family arsenosugar biosynthesis glycosyltransferase [Pseudomonadota bacterium]MDA1023681.1 TIGR04282 family arsenosugar biosynthesis glycosyltransferase [Pseudomonadota bacterium]